MARVFVTGSHGLIGSALSERLRADGHEVVGYDIAADRRHDVVDPHALASAMAGCSGVVHLAAVSRVIWGEHDPGACHAVNVIGTRNVLAATSSLREVRPWFLFGSSREVYGQARHLPVSESAGLAPLNCYARSKLDAELLVEQARAGGLNTAIVRFSSVYGSVADHPDRVAPAFARLAAEGGALRIDGGDTTLDFTHVSDVAEALSRMVERLSSGSRLPALHLVSGRATSLSRLADLAVRCASGGTIRMAAPRHYDVGRFVGDPARAARVLGWRATTGIQEGIERLVEDFAKR
ncbi:NAD(P)-dependent oxidoreductase [Streptomyces sp. NBC_01278]|uniref:NAD-dependent epimerase/dehydratase family protein n=1 Tax=Streptomyces sp. NBC_01278 TaxID=2903809 RepID=UPI002E33A68D|nr:NAD(P)-dependent oxidoreductase [Streptomyces sp. NBC_01278]